LKEEKMSSKNERKKGLGRGLSSFLDVDSFDEIVEISNPEKEVSKASNSSNFLPIEHLVPNQNQPRKNFSEDELKSLASSISETGIIQPILVRKSNSFYEIVAGERRWRAAQLAKIHEVPVLIKELTNEEVVKISIVENIQRVDLNPIEEANSYHQLIRDFGYTQEKVSSSLGKSRSYIANSLRLLSLPKSIIKFIEEGKLTSGHARALVGVKNSEFLAKKIIEEGLSVRDIENIVKKGIDQSNNRIEKKPSIKKDVDTLNLEQDLKMALGLKTVIDHNENSGRGSIIIKYRDLEQLDEFCSKIMKI
jgi:ParB family chromosome partitioning protein